MKVLVTIIVILLIMFACSHNNRARAAVFHPNPPTCRTICHTDENGNTTCTTTCYGGTN